MIETGRVLVIDDDPGTCHTISDVLELHGHAVESATAGYAGLERLTATPVDAAIVDIRLPDISGLDLLRAIRASSPDTEVIFITGHGSVATAVEAVNGAAFSYLTKPFEMPQLVAALEKALEKRRLGRALRDSEARYRALVEGSIQGLSIHRGFAIEFANASLAAMFGYAGPPELIGRDLRVLVAPDEIPRVEGYAAACQEGGPAPPRYEFQGVRRDGTLIWVETLMSVTSWRHGTALLATFVDVTERKRLEDHLRQSQKMEAIGRLAGGVAHDFNNLLTVISGRAQIELLRPELSGPSRRNIDLIAEAASRASTLTKQLLAFSRKQVLQPRVLDVDIVVARMEPLLRRLIGEDIDLVTATEPGLGRVRADPGQLEQVVLNLAVNARDAMPRGGRLTVETANAELDEAYARQQADVHPGPYVILAVSDTGVGMDAETRAHLFEPFFTTKGVGEGTGLGLATVYGIVKQSGGHITAYSEVGRGTTIKIYLPRVDAASEVRGAEPEPVVLRRGSETVLLVEDDEAVRELTCEVLEMHGYTVLAVADAGEAPRVLEGASRPIHLLVTDVVMPRLSGRELTERLRSLRPGLKVLYISGYAGTAVVHHGVLDPGTPFLQKPFTPDALLRSVRKVLDDGG
ncbi:MAG: hybrid sensor histidine kinase/response regulator [Candidatus Rokuibacteriota bacterium]|nr:MAG: hybrid sensor histidine kinase/response regulator [Candidatus Rokubacteria bacterium]